MQNEGDPGIAEGGICEVIRNLEYIDDGLYARQCFPCDYLVPAETPLGLFIWDDRANEIVRMMAISDITGEGGGGKLLVKDASGGETWALVGSLGDVDAFVVSSSANYRGIVYFCLGDVETAPTTFSYDGLTLRRGTAVPGLTARLVVVFGERLYFANLMETIVNELTTDPLGSAYPYNPSLWTLTNVAVTEVSTTISGRTATMWQIAPTAATGGKLELGGVLEVDNSADSTKFQMLVQLAGIDATYRMPMTISLIFRGLPWEASRGYVLGVRRHPIVPNGFVYVCTQAGTSGGSEPVWPLVLGGTLATIAVTAAGTGYTSNPTVVIGAPNVPGGVQATAHAVRTGTTVTSVVIDNAGTGYTSVPAISFTGGAGSGATATATIDITGEIADGSCKWKLESTDVIASQVIEVPSTSDSTDPISISIPGVVPPVVGSYVLMLRYAFGTTSTPSVSLLPVAFSLDDGQPDGTSVALKKNFGQQLTKGSYEFQFTASSPGTFALVDVGVWTEPGQPDLILAQNVVTLIEENGPITGLIVAGGRLWWFKRRAAWSYLLTQDPNFPIQREKVYTDVGSVGTKASDTHADILYTIAEHQVYGFDANISPVRGTIDPQELCPEGIRRLVMGRGAGWVEDLPASSGQKFTPILRVHPVRKQLWVYTQDQVIFIYDIMGKRWSYFDFPKNGGGNARIRDIAWNPTTSRMMIVTENGIGRQSHREEQGIVAAMVLTSGGAGAYSGTPTLTIGAPPAGGTQATATFVKSFGVIVSLTMTNPGSGYLAPPPITFSGGGLATNQQATAVAFLTVRDGDASGNVMDLVKRVRPRPYEMRPDRQVMTVEDVAIYGKIPMGQADSTCEVDISFDGGVTFTYYNRVRLAPLSSTKRRYPIPVRKTGDSLIVDLTHTGATGTDVFNVLDVDANVIMRGPEQPKTRPTPVAKNL